MKNFPVIRSNCYSPHSFERMINSLSDKETKESFSVFHNNVRSLRGNFKKLEEQLFSDLDFNFDLIGISETKITNSNQDHSPVVPGYNFEYVPTPLAAGGVGMYISNALNYKILEKKSTSAFQALWIEIYFTKKGTSYVALYIVNTTTPNSF